MADAYIEHTMSHPTDPKHDGNIGIIDHVRATLQRKARERGQSLADPEAVPEVAATIHEGIVDTYDGPMDVTTTTWRAAVVSSPDVPTGAVQAVEVDGDVWVAPVPPGVPVVSVRHGLNSLDVQVIAYDDDHERVGVHGFLSVTKDEVEVVLPGGSPAVSLAVILPPPEPEEHGDPQEAVVPS